MARLPSERFVMQQSDRIVWLIEEGTEREVWRFDPADGRDVAVALNVIQGSDLGDEDKAFACFWAGYFHAHAPRILDLAREAFITEADDGTVFVMNGTAIVVSFDPSEADAAARAQKAVHDSALSQDDKDRAHFWSGFFYGQACQGPR